MNILIISTACLPVSLKLTYGGVERLVYDFISVLNKRGIELTVAAPVGSEIPAPAHYFPTVHLPEQAWRDDIATNMLISQRLIPDGFDILHDFSHQHLAGRITHGYWAKPYPFLFMLWHPPTFNGLPNPIHEPAYNLCGIARWHAEGLAKLYNQEVKWSYLGIDTELFALQRDKSDRYLFLSAPLEQKGGMVAIRLAKKLGLNLDVVCGKLNAEITPYESELIGNCDGKQIRWVGAVSEAEKIRYYQNAKALIFPVLQNESFGLVMPEALSTGTPVFAFNHGSPREIVTDDVGRVVDTEAELEECLRQFEAKTLDFQPEKCRERAVKFFDREVMVDGFLGLYRELMKGNNWY